MATRSLSKPKAPAPKKPSRAQFDKYLALDDERLRLNREADAIRKEQAELGEAILAYANHAGGKNRTVECCGHRASVTSSHRSPYYLGELRKAIGAAKLEELKAQQPMKDSLNVEKL